MDKFQSRIHLFAQPSILTGVARLIDMGGFLNVYNVSESDNEADYYALFSDWLAVGDALETAIEQYQLPEGKIRDGTASG